jgi:hypothetical protein
MVVDKWEGKDAEAWQKFGKSVYPDIQLYINLCAVLYNFYPYPNTMHNLRDLENFDCASEV